MMIRHYPRRSSGIRCVGTDKEPGPFNTIETSDLVAEADGVVPGNERPGARRPSAPRSRPRGPRTSERGRGMESNPKVAPSSVAGSTPLITGLFFMAEMRPCALGADYVADATDGDRVLVTVCRSNTNHESCGAPRFCGGELAARARRLGAALSLAATGAGDFPVARGRYRSPGPSGRWRGSRRRSRVRSAPRQRRPARRFDGCTRAPGREGRPPVGAGVDVGPVALVLGAVTGQATLGRRGP